jgi:hypothetical protein
MTELNEYISEDEFPFEFDFAKLYTVTNGEVTYGYTPELPDGLLFETNQNGTGILYLTSPLQVRQVFSFGFYVVFCRNNQYLYHT